MIPHSPTQNQNRMNRYAFSCLLLLNLLLLGTKMTVVRKYGWLHESIKLNTTFIGLTKELNSTIKRIVFTLGCFAYIMDNVGEFFQASLRLDVHFTTVKAHHSVGKSYRTLHAPAGQWCISPGASLQSVTGLQIILNTSTGLEKSW